MASCCGVNLEGTSGSSVAASPMKPLGEINGVWGILVSRDTPPPQKNHPARCQGHSARGASGRRTQPEPTPTWKFLNPTLRARPQRVLTGIAAGTPPHHHATAPVAPPGAASRLPPPYTHTPRGWGFWGGASLPRTARGKQPHVPALACPALSRIPNPSHMVSISLGSAGACSAVSELTFPCLSVQLLARDARPSPRPWSSPALPVRTRLSRPRGGCGESGDGSCLCSALKL